MNSLKNLNGVTFQLTTRYTFKALKYIHCLLVAGTSWVNGMSFNCFNVYRVTVIFALSLSLSLTRYDIVTMLEQAEASIMYLGLNWRHWIGPGWSAFMTATLTPVSVFQQWIRPSVDPIVDQNLIQYFALLNKCKLNPRFVY